MMADMTQDTEKKESRIPDQNLSDRESEPWLETIDATKLPQHPVPFCYYSDGKWQIEICTPSFIRDHLIQNAKARYKKQHSRTTHWKGDKKGRGIDLIQCSCGCHFLGTKRIDFDCGPCGGKLAHARNKTNVAVIDAMKGTGGRTYKRGTSEEG